MNTNSTNADPGKIDNGKRTTLKLLAVTSAAMAAPAVVSAACRGHKTDTIASTKGNEVLQGTGLVISFADAKPGSNSRAVIITNTKNEKVTLSQVYPGIVSTPQGQYDINTLLKDGPLNFEPKQARTLNVNLQDKTMVEKPYYGSTHNVTRVSVRTRDANVNFGEPVITYRNMVS